MLVGDEMLKVYHDQDANLNLLQGRRIAVIGYGNHGRAQALNLRDSGLEVILGNREDEYAERARQDGFTVLSIQQAAERGEIVMLLIPDEVMPGVFEAEIAPGLKDGDVLVFASGYNIAFEGIVPPSLVDVVLVAPRMIGAGVRDLYVAGRGFPSFIGVARDRSGPGEGGCSGPGQGHRLHPVRRGRGNLRPGCRATMCARRIPLGPL
jgi:ketol-acid reductoisomerase